MTHINNLARTEINDGEIVSLSALELSKTIRARDVSCKEVMHAYLKQIDSLNPHVNALVSMRDSKSLLAEAGERDAQLARGEWLGWMHGMPQAVKDLAACSGLPFTYGSRIFSEQIVQHDALFVSRMRSAGAIFIGRTNVPEFGLGSHTYNDVYGITRNAYDQSRCAGGSSGGAAAALALRMLPVADGSDMMGSLRNPAAFNNVYGLRPSTGLVPFGPAPELFLQQLTTEGPMGRTVSDVAALLNTQAGEHPTAPLSKAKSNNFNCSLQANFKGAKVGWLGDLGGYLPTEPGLLSLCEAGLKDFESLGCLVEHSLPKFDMSSLWKCWLTHRHFLVSGILSQAYADPYKRSLLKPEAIWEIEAGLALSAQDFYKASLVRSDWHRTVIALFQQFDYLIMPSAQVFPFDAHSHWPTSINGKEMDTYHRWMEVVIGATLAGLPSMSVPIGFNPDGLPMGVQIMCRPGGDLDVLKLAYAHEQSTNFVSKKLSKLLL